jgi:7-cyano-7-deazaguanosine (preQ0) biosynthesis protein QueE
MSELRIAQEEQQPEIFYTLQGEGRNVGNPATFIRLSGCNLACVWCDTPYTWDWQNYDKKEEQMKIDIGTAQDRITGLQCERVVITGGEPMLQQTSLNELIEHIKGIDDQYRFEVETNGTIMPKERTIENIDQFNVSPKLDNSGMPYHKRIKPDVLKALNETGKADFKFVIDTDYNIEEVEVIQDQIGIQSDHIYLMPQGKTEAEQLEKETWLAEKCMFNKYNFTPRLHIQLWGSKRGV